MLKQQTCVIRFPVNLQFRFPVVKFTLVKYSEHCNGQYQKLCAVHSINQFQQVKNIRENFGIVLHKCFLQQKLIFIHKSGEQKIIEASLFANLVNFMTLYQTLLVQIQFSMYIRCFCKFLVKICFFLWFCLINILTSFKKTFAISLDTLQMRFLIGISLYRNM